MKTNSKKLICNETGEIFNSCREADRKYGWKYGTAWHVAAGKRQMGGVTLQFMSSVEQPNEIDLSVYKYVHGIKETDNYQVCEEEFKEIPYLPYYIISNWGRVATKNGQMKKLQKDKRYGCYTVFISCHSKPHFFSVKTLYEAAFNDNIADSIVRCALAQSGSVQGQGKTVKCLDDENEFKSYMECAVYYKLDYQRFREALHNSDTGQFTYKGKTFSIVA